MLTGGASYDCISESDFKALLDQSEGSDSDTWSLSGMVERVDGNLRPQTCAKSIMEIMPIYDRGVKCGEAGTVVEQCVFNLSGSLRREVRA